MSVVVLDPAEVHLEPDHSMRSDPTIKGTNTHTGTGTGTDIGIVCT